MTDQNPGADQRLVDGLNDLLLLEHDAAAAYNLAFENMRSDRLRLAARVFRVDHERHAGDLASLVRARGGEPLEAAHMPAGAFEQTARVAAAEGDREMLEALRINDALVRQHYRERASGALPEDLGSTVRRLAADEDRHWAWVTQALEALGGPTLAESAAAPPALRAPGATDAARAEAARVGAPEHVLEPLAAASGRADADAPGTVGDDSSRAGMAAAVGTGQEGPERHAVAGETMAAATAAPAPGGAGPTVSPPADRGARARAAAGTGLEEAARGLDRATSWARARGGRIARVASPTGRAARAPAREGTYVQRQDTDAVKRDIESSVRAHPIRTVLIVAALGFVVGRLLR